MPSSWKVGLGVADGVSLTWQVVGKAMGNADSSWKIGLGVADGVSGCGEGLGECRLCCIGSQVADGGGAAAVAWRGVWMPRATAGCSRSERMFSVVPNICGMWCYLSGGCPSAAGGVCACMYILCTDAEWCCCSCSVTYVALRHVANICLLLLPYCGTSASQPQPEQVADLQQCTNIARPIAWNGC